MSARVLAIFAVLVSAGCTTTELMCNAVREDLSRCGLPTGGVDCSTIDYGTLSALQGRLDRGTCDTAGDADAVDPRLCALAGWACPTSPTPAVASAATRYPIVLVSGIDDSPVFDWNPNIADALNAAGGQAHHVVLSSWMPTTTRANDLAESLATLHATLGTKVNLVCYAVAGLDCRYLVSPGGLYAGDPATRAQVLDSIASITTMSTPHRGTRVADAAIVALQSSTVGEVLQSLFGVTAPDVLPDNTTLLTALRGLTVDALVGFNEKVVDEPSLIVDSYAGVSTPFGIDRDADETQIAELCVDGNGKPAFQRQPKTMDALNALLLIAEPFSHETYSAAGAIVSTPSDGMIPLASAKWGRFRGCLPVDHYDVIGQVGNRTRDPLTGFDERRFYGWLAADLASRGL